MSKNKFLFHTRNFQFCFLFPALLFHFLLHFSLEAKAKAQLAPKQKKTEKISATSKNYKISFGWLVDSWCKYVFNSRFSLILAFPSIPTFPSILAFPSISLFTSILTFHIHSRFLHPFSLFTHSCFSIYSCFLHPFSLFASFQVFLVKRYSPLVVYILWCCVLER